MPGNSFISGTGSGIDRAIAEKLAGEQIKLIHPGENHIKKLNEIAAIDIPDNLTSPVFYNFFKTISEYQVEKLGKYAIVMRRPEFTGET